jgi:hypothetical protein
MPDQPGDAAPGGSSSLIGYFGRLWSGAMPLSRVFWTDMLIIGSAVNLAAMLLAILLFIAGAPVWLGVFIHFSPLPYNILLLLAVWRSAAREASTWGFLAQIAGVLWLAAATLL